MSNRLKLQELLEGIIGNRNVYFQPPESMKINYPAIIYSRDDIGNIFADDSVYRQNRTYKITVIDYDPDSEIVEKVSKLPMCRFNTHFKSDNLNHDVFVINY